MIGLFVCLSFILGSIILNKPTFLGLILSTTFIYLLYLNKGYSYKTLNNSLISGLFSAKKVLIILSLIGMLTSIWMISGTIPYLMHLGLSLLMNYNFLFLSFIIMSFISLILGSSSGSISTIGVVLMSIGKSIGIDPFILAGAIVSGAFIGDRSSPLSACLNLTTEITNTTILGNIKILNRTLFPSFILASLIYYIIGMSFSNIDLIQIENTLKTLSTHFVLTPFALIPLIVLFVSIIFRINIATSIFLSIVASCIFCISVLKIGFTDIASTLLFGFHSTQKEVSSLISGGGLISMLRILLTIASSAIFTGIIGEVNLLSSFFNKLTCNITSKFSLMLRTGFLSIFINMLTCNQTIGIIIPGKFMNHYFKNQNMRSELLVHSIADMGTITVPLIPWNINSIISATVLGVSAFEFIPYSFLCYFLPLMFIIRYKFIEPS
ncbi:Na+/H+ antiporter NhaC family protein [Alkalithermobacter paradoxus]|uniref:Malate-2H(+)/Na(+)-lactate antiporter n=1 Tax=Alkalithermobacter paradoxus TaxID=29349 RepID=A0A1V4I3Y7_9FIRM|nr:malate-2H(+)/Na(+)-lactate antiporter [[Clostridium] thermoalcaliphilum]